MCVFIKIDAATVTDLTEEYKRRMAELTLQWDQKKYDELAVWYHEQLKKIKLANVVVVDNFATGLNKGIFCVYIHSE